LGIPQDRIKIVSIKSKVALVRCDSYEQGAVEAAVARGISLLGGMETFIRPGEKILLKPNMLVGEAPEKLVGPHPLVFQAVARQAQAVTSQLTYGDAPGFGKPLNNARKAGLAAAAEALKIPFADFENGREVQFHDSPFLKSFILANGVLDADGLISICKFKTHALTRLTGAVKNQFGCIPGLYKGEFHIKMPNPLDFAKMLVVINLYLRPRLFVMDGIMAMEGNGPRGGDPRAMNVLLFSADPIALDATAARMVHLDAEFLPTSIPGREWGLGTYHPDEIEYAGDALDSFINKDFNVVRQPVRAATRSSRVTFMRNLVSPRPVIDPAKCNLCGTCVRVCPVNPKTVNWHDGDKSKPPTYQYERCIRCFCCQELCPDHAIRVETPWLGRVLRGKT
jgi:uncharacterized protein (DUF362 family)/Pyruvate/2-oxoacid:ferredoxin oxidoreductase delta subunit